MATNRRISRVAELIKREVSQCCSMTSRMTVWVQELSV
jgi:hypothetical protein